MVHRSKGRSKDVRQTKELLLFHSEFNFSVGNTPTGDVGRPRGPTIRQRKNSNIMKVISFTDIVLLFIIDVRDLI